MGMEGKLRQISEFELAAYRKNPASFYSQLKSRYTSGSIGDFTSAMLKFQQSPLAKRIQSLGASGQRLAPEDLEELRRQQEAILNEYRAGFEEMQTEMMGLSKDGSQLSLYKDWHVLHYLLTGKGWEPTDSPMGWAIMGAAELPDAQETMGYGPARFLTPGQVREVKAALVDCAFEEKIAALDPDAAKAAKIYGASHLDRVTEPDEKDALIDYFKLLRDFYETAADKGNAVIMWIE